MIQTIARKELAETLRSGRFRLAAGLTLALLVAAALAGVAQTRREAAERTAAAAADREAWVGQGENNPHSAAHYGMWAFKPAAPLAAFDPGVTPYTGTALFMEAHAVQDARYRPAEDAPAGARLGTLSPALVLQLLVPLVLILLLYDTLAGERERGTLRQLLALGVPPRRLLAGKALAALVPVGLVLAAALVLALAALAATDGARGGARVAGLGLAYALYLTAFVGVALAVSARAATARGALAALVGVWVVACVLVPRLAATAAEWAVPTPSAAELADARAADLAALPEWDARTAEIEADLMRTQGVTRPEDLSTDAGGYVLDWFETEETRINRRHEAALADRYARQQRVAAWGALASPLVALQGVSMGLSGTDLAHHRHFADAAERHRFAVVKQLNTDLMENERPGERRLVGAAFWETVPALGYAPPPAGWALGRQLPGLLALALWAAAGVALALASARRLRPA